MSVALWTVGTIVYCLLILATWCAGAFGIGASRSDVFEREMERKTSRYPSLGRDYFLREVHASTRVAVGHLWVLTFFAGLVWPFAIPMYLAYRKGVYVDDALTKRVALAKENGR